jgi:hypothetical protein
VQFSKLLLPICVILLAPVTVVRAVQLLNALSFISVTPVKLIVYKELQPQKA